MTTGGVNPVVGFRPSLWARVAPEEMPAGVTDFDREVRGVDGYTMPATQHDLWLWVAGHAYHKVFDVTREAIAALRSEEHTSELQSHSDLVCRLLLEKKKTCIEDATASDDSAV